MNTYLIDFENVNDLGMNGIHDLLESDRVYIIYTDNANRICLDWFEGVRASISVVHVESGSQSLDMHLVSFLGYLLGQEDSVEDQYVIVSEDRDYLGVTSFWCSRYGDCSKVILTPSICGKALRQVRSQPVSNHDILVDRIKAIIKKHGTFTENGLAILVGSLCGYLNNEISFKNEGARLGLKRMKLLATCDDVIDIIQYNKTEWAVLKGTAWASATTVAAEETDTTPADGEIYDSEEDAHIFTEEDVLQIDQLLEDGDYIEHNDDTVGGSETIDEDLELDMVNDEQTDAEETNIQIDIDPADIDVTIDEPVVLEDDTGVSLGESSEPDLTQEKVSIITSCMLAHGMESSDVAELAEWVALLISERTGKRSIYQAVLTRYGLKRGLLVYGDLRESLKTASIPGGNCFASDVKKGRTK